MRVARTHPPRVCGIGTLPSTSAALRCGARCIHRHHSPDRSYSQEIQDRQNAFRWSAHHVFRPHQHFTYDPTSWSRPLEEKVKKSRTLSLVERVKTTAEHVAERAGYIATLDDVTDCRISKAQKLAEPASEIDVPDYFFAARDASTRLQPATVSVNSSTSSSGWTAVSLQELIEEVQRLQSLLHSPRYTGNASLQRRARQDADFHTTLWQLYERLRDARVGETVTLDACVFGWFLLTRNLEPLIEAVARAHPQEANKDSSESSDEAAAIRDVFAALRTVVLQPMAEGRCLFKAATSGELSLEALIEILSIATLPFVRRCAEDDVLESQTLVRYAECISAAARQRALDVAADPDAAEHAAAQEWLDPPHLAAWATSLKRLQAHEVPILGTVSGLEVQVEHAADYVTQLLETITGVTPGGHVIASLSRPQPRTQKAASQMRQDAAPKPVCLDATAAPHGVQNPPTESGDAVNILVAATAVLHLSHRTPGTSVAREEGARRIVRACLRMLTHTPNYDLCPDDVVAWASEVLDAEHLMHMDDLYCAAHGGGGTAGGSGTAALRFLLLLSRLSYGSVVHRGALGRMVLCLCRWPEPAHTSSKESSEWRRLRGVVMRGALCVLQVPDLEAGAAQQASEETTTWLEALAFGEYGGVVPMTLWRDAALSLFPHLCYHAEGSTSASSPSPPRVGSSASRCRPEEAQALCVLCSRYVAREKTGVSAPANLRSIFTARCIAECLAVLLGNPALPDALLRSADAWDGLCASLPESVKVVATCMQEVVRLDAPPPKVLSF
ncbi:conserved hypothetical protein [Leishmania major strain Friedlin]|uniref:Uncharacterized protein n=1 Tax=Leishmania major TaxID=5664 RepID=Q4QF08_LEIMA|nr:conserved hypothetical protein [Leishmania major strain Friedlin]CAG9572046.1 hypothetical_protein_-_conserved [Leishmania major strain Friedlin]CAJ03423.1 conserved hypothetical protein [Leishmania major strain Friedlin]|eukprot:XP_001682090.1 conserved hypothetical protein [Leishmania major strain Friedlin]